jgi:predicted CoA-binding protein
MLEARSVAVVGASVKEGSLGRAMLEELRRGGYEGDVWPVNPGYEEVLGLACFPSIADVPGTADLAILGVANHRIEQATHDALAAGARSLATFSSLYEEEPPEPGAPPLTERIATAVREAGVPFCGGNGMGFLHETADHPVGRAGLRAGRAGHHAAPAAAFRRAAPFEVSDVARRLRVADLPRRRFRHLPLGSNSRLER